MVVGFAADERARRVIGIDASATPVQTKAQVLQIAQYTARLVELRSDIVEEDIVLLEDYAYPAYGIPSENTKAAIRLCARLEGMITDPVYDGAKGALSIFDPSDKDPGIAAPIRSLTLASSEVLEGGVVWLRYRLQNR
jgi:1-aminocyclopropane-1-carboxylate deaminase/D-cysteine desulfhydrase-like pyridoxal-dependent ACC family enzyme